MKEFISYLAMQQTLSELCDELPVEFFNELNLGVVLDERLMVNPHSRAGQPLYILGHYIRNQMGRQIVIYYGSFAKVYRGFSPAALKIKLRETLRHEFRHHLEYLAGERGLEIEDQRRMAQYLYGGNS